MIDVRHRRGTWSNPESWLAEVRPFSDRLIIWPWIAYLVTIAVLTAVALRIATRRDLAPASWPRVQVVPSEPRPRRPAPATAGLLFRLTRGSALAWPAAGVAAAGRGHAGNPLSRPAADVRDATSFVVEALARSAVRTRLSQAKLIVKSLSRGQIRFSPCPPPHRGQGWQPRPNVKA